jgi:DNA-binding response OmpR family regulator
MKDHWRILVVEDDPDGQALVAHVLDYLSIPIDVANDAEEAEKFLFDSGKTYTAVIIDLALPGKDGWDLLAQIQANSKTSNLPCLAITAFHTSKLREEAIRAGFTAYFAKPLDATSFARELEAVL